VLKPFLVQIGAYFAWDLHDGIYLYVPTKVLAYAVSTMHQMLLDLPYASAWGYTPPIALPWDCKVGPAWGQLKEWTHGD
jgi:hypothetical protein